MKKLSVIIPSRDEKFLTKTIDDVFQKRGSEDTEVVAVLDSERWPGDWKEVTERHPSLTTIHNGKSIGMRGSINKGVASAYQRGAQYVMKIDGHVMLDEGFDLKIIEHLQPNWVMVPRRKRLDADNWTLTDTHKTDIDYHYLSFPNDPNDFGGAGLNGKVWEVRAKERRDNPEYVIDDEMASQGSAWAMFADYFYELELMDEENYGPFWNESQEIFNKCWLSGGRCVINKHTWYAHLHKGTKHGRGYKLDEKWLTKGRNHTMLWPWNEAWPKQTLPFKWLIEHFWPVPSWPENWEEILYATRKPKSITGRKADAVVSIDTVDPTDNVRTLSAGLVIHKALYGVGGPNDIDVTERLQSLVVNGSLDIIVNNSTLVPGQNPFRGKKKQLWLEYCLDEHVPMTRTVAEKDWLIIGPVAQTAVAEVENFIADINDKIKAMRQEQENTVAVGVKRGAPVFMGTKDGDWQEIGKFGGLAPMTAAALNDYLIRKFQISDRRLRGPMPIELRDFHRNDLAQLFAELGFKRGAEIGVAEGHYSEILLKANPDLELLLVDPWRRYDGNPYAHSQEHQDFSLNETKRKTAPYPNVRIMQDFSMNAVREVEENSLDFTYVDAHHGFDWVMQDLIEWGKRVRSGGIISGDDYYHFKRHWAGVIEAVNAYTQAHRVSPWFLIDAPRSVDFFWVKV